MYAQSIDESLTACLERLAGAAVQAVQAGAEVLVLDDTRAFEKGWLPVDSHLALASIDRALRETDGANGHALRRNCSLVLVSGGLRNLHDIIFAFSLGADAFCAYLMLEAGVLFDAERAEIAPEERLARLGRLIEGLCKGLEKVISTMGTHELRGYGRNFAGIGVAPSLAAILEIPMLCCKEGWRCGITPAEEYTYAREPICPYRKTRLPHRPTNPTYLRPPKKPTRLHLPPARRLRHAQNLPQLHLPRP
jgi:glutamate synthase (NADPH/NADH) large chain